MPLTAHCCTQDDIRKSANGDNSDEFYHVLNIPRRNPESDETLLRNIVELVAADARNRELLQFRYGGTLTFHEEEETHKAEAQANEYEADVFKRCGKNNGKCTNKLGHRGKCNSNFKSS